MGEQTKPITVEQHLWDALKLIASYDDPEKLDRTAQKRYGLPPDEAIRCAYENVLETAQQTTRLIRRPKCK